MLGEALAVGSLLLFSANVLLVGAATRRERGRVGTVGCRVMVTGGSSSG